MAPERPPKPKLPQAPVLPPKRQSIRGLVPGAQEALGFSGLLSEGFGTSSGFLLWDCGSGRQGAGRKCND